MVNTGKLQYSDRFTNYLENTITSDTSGDSVSNELSLSPDNTYVLAIELTGNQYRKMFSSLLAGSDLIYGEEAHQLSWILWKAAKNMTFCEQVLACVQGSSDIINEITNITNVSGGNPIGDPNTVLPSDQREANIFTQDMTCDYDHIYAVCVGIVEAIHAATIEVFEAIEVLTNPLELAAEIADDIPLAELVTVSADIIIWVQDTIYEVYSLAWSDTVKDAISCELFCLIKDRNPCTISFEDVMSVYLDPAFSDPPSIFDPYLDWVLWLIDLVPSAGELAVKMGGLLGLIALRYGGLFGDFILGIRTFNTTVQLLQDDINPDWSVLCTDCPTTWIHEWDFVNYGADTFIIGTGNVGSFQSGIGFVGGILLLNGYTSEMVSRLEFNETIPRVTQCVVTFDMVRGVWSADSTGFYLSAGGVTYTEWNSGYVVTGNNLTKSITFEQRDANQFVAFLRASRNNSGNTSGSVIVTGVTMSGNGVDPFYGRVTALRHEGEI